jgi:hypothetical protein
MGVVKVEKVERTKLEKGEMGAGGRTAGMCRRRETRGHATISNNTDIVIGGKIVGFGMESSHQANG